MAYFDHSKLNLAANVLKAFES